MTCTIEIAVHPLTDLRFPDGPTYTLDFEHQKIVGEREYGRRAIQRILYFQPSDGVFELNLVGIKVWLGPLLVFEPFETSSKAHAHLRLVVKKLGLDDQVGSSKLSPFLADPFLALKKRCLRARFRPNRVLFSSTRVMLPILVDTEYPKKGSSAVAHLVLCREAGVWLYDGLGRSENVCDLDQILELSKEERTSYSKDSDVKIVLLKLALPGSRTVELRFWAHQIEASSSLRDIEESTRGLAQARSCFRRLRKFLGMSAYGLRAS